MRDNESEGKIKMKKKILSVLLLTTLALSLFSVVAPTLAANPRVVIHLKGALNPDTQLTYIMSNMSWVSWSVVYEDIGASDLTGPDMLIMIQGDSSSDYTGDEGYRGYSRVLRGSDAEEVDSYISSPYFSFYLG